MALSGDFLKINNGFSDTETITNYVTYPSDLPENNPNYSKRGTTVEEEQPAPTVTEETLSNVYVIITGTTIEKHMGVGQYNINYAYRVYNSKEDKDFDMESHIHTDIATFVWDDTLDTTPLVRCYEHLSSSPHSVNLTNA